MQAEKCRRDLKAFIRTAWLITEPSELVWGWHIDAIAEHLTAVSAGQILRLLITIPPRHGKSLIVSVLWPSWEWISRPEGRWLCGSYADSLSIRDNVRSRRLIQSNWYQANWGSIYQFEGDQNQKSKVETSRGGSRIAVGVAGSTTGEGGDRLLIDDPHNIKEAESDQVRKGILDWHDTVWSTRANDPRTTARVIICQRCHQADLAGHVLEQGGWEHLSIPAEYDGEKRRTIIGWSDPRTAEGELLWPARFGPSEIAEQKRTLGSYAYSAQYQQQPSPSGGGIFKRHWWRYWQPRGASLPPVIVHDADGLYRAALVIDAPIDGIQVESWDCAFKDIATSDYVVGHLWARAGSGYLLGDQVRGQMDFPATVKAVRDLTARYPYAVAKLIEDKANGSAVIATLAHEIPGILAINPQGGKQARAAAVSPLVEAGNVYLPHPQLASWVDDFIEECARFPNGKHDDMVDAMSQALTWLLWFNPGQPETAPADEPYRMGESGRSLDGYVIGTGWGAVDADETVGALMGGGWRRGW